MDNDAPRSVRVHRVRLETFRNYAELDLELSSRFNVLAGPNAQGKTNFLEALYLVATTRLLRGQRDAEAIQGDRPTGRVEVELADSGTRLGVALHRGLRKRATLNGLALPRASDLLGRLPCVCVSLADTAIVRGEPSDRRLFLDLELSALFPAYLRHLSLYKRALEQRNALLRASQEWMQAAVEFEPWEEQMAEHGAAMRTIRRAYIDRLSSRTALIHADLGDGERIELASQEKDPATTKETLRSALEASRPADVARGGSSVGPHRDDLAIGVEDREARLYGSQGQQRTAVISIKLATLALATEELGFAPLLLLDDILSDLDERRRARLVEVVLAEAGQAVLTCTEATAAGERILHEAKVFQVRAGTVTER